MVWALLVLFAVVFAVHYWEYSRSIQEYTFSQPPGPETDMRTVLSEKTPVIMELGKLPWRPSVAEKAPWSVQIVSDDTDTDTNGVRNVSIGAWIADGPTRKPLLNSEALAEQIDIPTGLAELDTGRAWWWLAGFQDCAVNILPADGWLGLSWVTAERQWIGCSHGAPLKVWLAHSRYKPFLPSRPNGVVNPWTVTVAEAPWLGRVQYMEVLVHPGWCLGLPAHWGWAATVAPGTVAPALGAEAEAKTEEESWYWLASQHSPLSMGFAVYKDLMTKRVQVRTESLSSESVVQ
jgi:hypothetical protein